MFRSSLAAGIGGITAKSDSFAELHAMIADAVKAFFAPDERPQRIRLHFLGDTIVALG